MARSITPEQMTVYREGWRRRSEQRKQTLRARHARAWEVARHGAQLLKELGAESVVVFGSLPFPEKFHERSDVDLATWGLDERLYLKALARLLDIDPQISVDLVEAEFASPGLRARIAEEELDL